MRYFITFACYGQHLHGDESGSVDRRHNLFGGRLLHADPGRATAELQKMDQTPYLLDEDSRGAVLEALREVCLHRSWSLLSAHVRTTHVHTVVEAEDRPEKVMNDFKAYASRSLNRLASDGSDRKRWARHGSTRWLWTGCPACNPVRRGGARRTHGGLRCGRTLIAPLPHGRGSETQDRSFTGRGSAGIGHKLRKELAAGQLPLPDYFKQYQRQRTDQDLKPSCLS
jgi:hypothetical protein